MLLAFPLLLGSFSQRNSGEGPGLSGTPASGRGQAAYVQAAALARSRNCRGARGLLSPLIEGKGPDAPYSLLLSGFYAHLCQDLGAAEEGLFTASDPSGLLEDWRLFLLSQDAAARGHQLVARAALAKLLGDYPASPLRAPALLAAANLEWQNGEAANALRLIAESRREGVRGDAGRDLERLAWDIGSRQGDRQTQLEAARHLLIEHPATAAELNVTAVVQTDPGLGLSPLAWSALLSGEQLKRRAETLLGLGLAPNALSALDAVAPGERDFGWSLLKAQALTLCHRGAEALELAASLNPATPQDSAALEWARATATADVVRSGLSGSRGGRRGDGSERPDRAELRQVYQQHLQKVVQIGADPELSAKALRSLYGELAAQDLHDLAVEALRQLRRLDPRDSTGADDLWNRGWGEFSRANYTKAIGAWADLAELYPREAATRRGRYWTARAYDLLGETERARQLYAEIAGADTVDFYSKNAMERLGIAPRTAAFERSGKVEAWPGDPALGRARLLSDLGLEPLAWTEMGLVQGKAEPRAQKALEALLLARQGERRKSIVVLREAFPALGTAFQAALPDEALKLYYPLDYQDSIRAWAGSNQLPLSLVLGVIRQESAFDRFAQSSAGARGLMQLMPATAREVARHMGLGFAPNLMHEPDFNVRVGTTYLRQVLDMFGKSVELGLAGYNGGPYRIKRLWQESGMTDIDRFLEGLSLEESKVYVKRILLLSDSYRRLYPQVG